MYDVHCQFLVLIFLLFLILQNCGNHFVLSSQNNNCWKYFLLCENETLWWTSSIFSSRREVLILLLLSNSFPKNLNIFRCRVSTTWKGAKLFAVNAQYYSRTINLVSNLSSNCKQSLYFSSTFIYNFLVYFVIYFFVYIFLLYVTVPQCECKMWIRCFAYCVYNKYNYFIMFIIKA